MEIIIYIVVGFVLFAFFQKAIAYFFKPRKKTLNVLSGLLTLIATPFMIKYIFLLLFNLILYEHHPIRKFNSISWFENVENRHQMRQDMLDKGLFLNKSTEKIEIEFGIPHSKIDSSSKWLYYLGSRGWGLGFKFYYLELTFDNKRVKSVEIQERID